MPEPIVNTCTTPAFACNLTAISAPGRAGHNELAIHVRSAMRDKRAITNGYAFTLSGEAVTLPEVAEWIAFERLCCPFLTLQLSASGSEADWRLTLTGPAGVEALLDAEFPVEAFGQPSG